MFSEILPPLYGKGIGACQTMVQLYGILSVNVKLFS